MSEENKSDVPEIDQTVTNKELKVLDKRYSIQFDEMKKIIDSLIDKVSEQNQIIKKLEQFVEAEKLSILKSKLGGIAIRARLSALKEKD